MKQVSSRLRMELAQYRELSTFAQFGSDIDSDTRKVLNAGERMMAALRQNRYAPLEDWKQAVLLFAVSEGFAEAVEPERMEEFENGLYYYMEGRAPEMVRLLQSGRKLDAEGISRLKETLSVFAEEAAYGDAV